MAAGARHRDVDRGVHAHHPQGRQGERQCGDRREQAAHDRVDDPALLEGDVDRAGESDQERRVGHGLESRDKPLRRSGGAQPSDESHHDAHREEQRCHLVEPPAEAQHADHEQDERREHHGQGDALADPQSVARVRAAGRIPRRSGAGPGRVAHGTPNPHGERGHQEADAKHRP